MRQRRHWRINTPCLGENSSAIKNQLVATNTMVPPEATSNTTESHRPMTAELTPTPTEISITVLKLLGVKRVEQQRPISEPHHQQGNHAGH